MSKIYNEYVLQFFGMLKKNKEISAAVFGVSIVFCTTSMFIGAELTL